MRQTVHDCLVVRVVDGDTLDVDFIMSDAMLGVSLAVRHRLRLARVNCPEMNTDKGKAAKAFVVGLLRVGDPVKVCVPGKDRYGRFVAEVVLADGRNVSDLLLAANQAEVYALAAMIQTEE